MLIVGSAKTAHLPGCRIGIANGCYKGYYVKRFGNTVIAVRMTYRVAAVEIRKWYVAANIGNKDL